MGFTSKKSLAVLLKHYAHSNGVDIEKCKELISKISNKNKSLTKSEFKKCKGHLRQIIFRCNDNNSLKQIHSSIDSAIVQNDQYINATLIKCYGKYSNVKEALRTYNSVKQKDTKVVYAMMTLLLQHNQTDKALSIYDTFNDFSDDSLNILAIKAYSQTDQFSKAKRIIYKSKMKMNHKHLPSKTVLIDFYGKSGDINDALKVFSNIPPKQMNVFIIGSMMKAYNYNGYYEESLQLYDKYETLQDDLCHLMAIKACLYTDNVQKGQTIHSKIDLTHTRFKTEISTALIEFYGHFNEVRCAENIFQSLSGKKRSDIVINTMMSALISNNCHQKAMKFYDECKSNENEILHLQALQLCVSSDNYEQGTKIHQFIASNKMNIASVKLINALISFYGSFGDIENAKKVFDCINDEQKDAVCFNAMMDAYCNNNMNTECIELFKQMTMSSCEVQLDVRTYAIVFKACTQGSVYDFGKDIHNQLKEDVSSNEWILGDKSVQFNLINMYGQCGMLDECKKIFEMSQHKGNSIDVWNAMIYVFGRNGDMKKANKWYDGMKRIGLKPNSETYKILLNACSTCGDMEQAGEIWNNMEDDSKYDPFVINPFIDCKCRKGMLTEAKELIVKFNPNDEIAWISLLNGYQSNKSIVLNTDDMTDIYECVVNVFGPETNVMRLYDQIMCNG